MENHGIWTFEIEDQRRIAFNIFTLPDICASVDLWTLEASSQGLMRYIQEK